MINICVFAFIIAPGGNESICVRKPAGWWFGSFFIFHHIWDVILPIDFHTFQDGYCTTNQFMMLTFW
jgi:hypothetical protein